MLQSGKTHLTTMRRKIKKISINLQETNVCLPTASSVLDNFWAKIKIVYIQLKAKDSSKYYIGPQIFLVLQKAGGSKAKHGLYQFRTINQEYKPTHTNTLSAHTLSTHTKHTYTLITPTKH